MLYCFKIETLQGIKEKQFATLEECKKEYDKILNYLGWGNDVIYGVSRIYTIKK